MVFAQIPRIVGNTAHHIVATITLQLTSSMLSHANAQKQQNTYVSNRRNDVLLHPFRNTPLHFPTFMIILSFLLSILYSPVFPINAGFFIGTPLRRICAATHNLAGYPSLYTSGCIYWQTVFWDAFEFINKATMRP